MATLVGNYSFLLSGQNQASTGAGGVGTADIVLDNRRSLNYAYVMAASTPPSAVVGIDASFDGTAWLRALTLTAVNASAQLQVSAYYPYVRSVVTTAFGGGGVTGTASVFWAGGLNSVLG